MDATFRLAQERRHATFDVICAGKPLWKVEGLARSDVRFTAGIMNTACLLARAGIRVGLATELEDDLLGRTWLGRTAALGIDVAGVTLASQAAPLFVVDATGGQSELLSERGTEPGLDIPPDWSARVLLLSGLSPVLSTAAALCKAARSARRQGAMVVLDLMAGLRQWLGRDGRTIAMVLREADVVRCSLADLFVIGTDVATVRRALRPGATLVVNDHKGATAIGTFGEVDCALGSGDILRTQDGGDACTAAICAELARPSALAESVGGRWHRVLQRWAATVADMEGA